jgi:hypothetical protein
MCVRIIGGHREFMMPTFANGAVSLLAWSARDLPHR